MLSLRSFSFLFFLVNFAHKKYNIFSQYFLVSFFSKRIIMFKDIMEGNYV